MGWEFWSGIFSDLCYLPHSKWELSCFSNVCILVFRSMLLSAMDWRTSLGSDYVLLFFWLLPVHTLSDWKRIGFFLIIIEKNIVWKYESDSLCSFFVSSTVLGIVYFTLSLFLFYTTVVIFDLVVHFQPCLDTIAR